MKQVANICGHLPSTISLGELDDQFHPRRHDERLLRPRRTCCTAVDRANLRLNRPPAMIAHDEGAGAARSKGRRLPVDVPHRIDSPHRVTSAHRAILQALTLFMNSARNCVIVCRVMVEPVRGGAIDAFATGRRHSKSPVARSPELPGTSTVTPPLH